MMKKKSLPVTSLDAYRQSRELAEAHQKKIIDVLREVGIGSYEDISIKAKLDRHAVGRRMSELEKLGIVYKPGDKKPTKSGRMAFVYCLTEGNFYKTDKQKKEVEKFFEEYTEGKHDEPEEPKWKQLPLIQ